MNRSVLARQMFAQGGAAVPNEYKGFSKLPEAVQMKMDPVAAKKYAEGGIAGMMPADMPPPPPMPADMPPPPMPAADPMPPMGQQAIDPQVLEGLLGEASKSIGNLDEAEDYATVMNSIRGDDATIEERYAELAEVVGPEDAQQTPESVLTLVQPAMVMAAVDQGIGGLAAEEMTQPVQGAMAQGIMSTMAPPEPAPMPPAAPPMAPPMMGGPPPANFKDGGLVRRGDNQPVQMYANGGETRFFGPRVGITPDQSRVLRQQIDTVNLQEQLNAAQSAPTVRPLKEVFDETKGTYSSLLGGADKRAADLEEQKKLTQAQMLFDIANTALAFAAPMEGERAGMSAAERLAMAARTTQLPQTIGARAQQQLEYKKAADKEERALDLAALQSAEATRTAEAAARSKFRQKQMELDAKQTPLGEGDVLVDSSGKVIAEGPAKSFNIGPGEKRIDSTGKVIAEGAPTLRNISPGDTVIDSSGKVVAEAPSQSFTLGPGQKRIDSSGKVIAEGPEKLERLGKGDKIIDSSGKVIAEGDGESFTLGPGQKRIDASGKVIAEGVPKLERLNEGDKLVDAKGKVIAEGAGKSFTLGPGQKRIDASGKVIAEGPEKELVPDDVKYLSDADRIDKYANNTLGDETAQFEQAILDYANKPTGLVFDGSNYIPSTAPGLSRQLISAIQAREAAGHGSVAGQLPQGIITPVIPEDGVTATGTTAAALPTLPSGRVDITTPQFNATLFAEDGSVNLNSSSWDNVPINIIDRDLNYPGTTGLLSGIQKLKNYFGETLREVGGSGLTQEGQEFSRAEADMTTIRNRILSYITQGGAVDDNDRILKFVQEQLAEETNKLTPGMFTTDETALSKLSSVEEQLASNFQTLAQRVTEYGGTRGAYSEDQVRKARAKLGGLKNLIAEVRALRKIYETALEQGALGLTPANRQSAKEWLRGNRASQTATGDVDG